MSYSKTNWVDHTAPFLEAKNLNKIEDGISQAVGIIPQVNSNTNSITALSTGEHYQGVFTPATGAEYPQNPQKGYSWYIDGLTAPYPFTGGDLNGKHGDNGDKMLYSGTSWSLIEKATVPSDVVLRVDLLSNLNTVDKTKYPTVVVEEDERGGTFVYDASHSSENDNGTVFDGWVRQYEGAVYPQWFGLVQAYAGTDKHTILKYLFENFSHVVVKDINITMVDGVIAVLSKDLRVEFINSTFTGDKDAETLFIFTQGSNHLTLTGLKLDGTKKYQRGIHHDGSAEISNCDIKNLFSSTEAATGILSTISSPKSVVNIFNNHIYDIDGVRTGATGNGQGAARATYSTVITGGEGTVTTISNNNFHDITAREGDIVHVAQGTDWAVDKDTLFVIKNNYLKRSNRRQIKAQCSKVHIIDNSIFGITSNDPDIGTDAGMVSIMPIGATRVFDSIVSGNTFDALDGMSLSLAVDNIDNVTISNNVFRSVLSSGIIFKVTGDSTLVTFTNNTIHSAGVPFALQGVNRIYINNNIFNLYANAKYLIYNPLGNIGNMVINNNVINVESSVTLFLGILYIERTEVISGINYISGNTINSSVDANLPTRNTLVYNYGNVVNTSKIFLINNIIPKASEHKGTGTMANIHKYNNYLTDTASVEP